MSAPTTPELLPCPFCNGEACINSEPNRVWRRVQCTGCETEQVDSHSLEEAVALWNTRAALAAPASPWLPISSAPKHTEVLVWREDSGPFIAQLSTPEGVFATDVLEKMGDSFGDDFEEWYSEAYGWQEGSEKPTHWQQLPPGPAEQGEPT